MAELPGSDASGAARRPASRPLLPQLDARRVAILAGLGLLSVALLLALGGGRAALTALGRADWRLLAVAAVIHYSGFALRGHRWQLLLRSGGHRLSLAFVTALLLAGWFVSALLPARAGDLLRIGVLRLGDEARPVIPAADSLGSIVMERLLDMGAILVLGAAFGAWVLRSRLPGWVLTTYLGAAVLLLALLSTLVAMPRFFGQLRRLSAHTGWLRALDFAGQAAASLHGLLRHPGLASLVVGESLAIWLCDALLLWLVIAALGEPIALAAAAFVALTVDVIAAVPVTPGGVGQIETAYAALLALLGPAVVNIGVVVLTTRLISYWSFLLVSGVVTLAAGFGAALRRPSTTPTSVIQ